MEQAHPAPQDNSRLIRRLLLLVALAFVFAFALVPLYNVLCEATGFNGKTSGKGIVRDGFAVGGLNSAAMPAPAVDLSRTVRVEFTGTVMPGLPWDMRPLTISPVSYTHLWHKSLQALRAIALRIERNEQHLYILRRRPE